jgi:hypothetical protein
MKHGQQFKRDLRSIQPSPFADGVAPSKHEAIIRSISPGANGSLTAYAWPGCPRGSPTAPRESPNLPPRRNAATARQQPRCTLNLFVGGSYECSRRD